MPPNAPFPPAHDSHSTHDARDGHSFALKGDGTVAAWRLNGAGQATVPKDLAAVTATATTAAR